MVGVTQYADRTARTLGLSKYKKSKFPGTFHLLQIKKGQDGRFLTGFDENALEVLNMKDSDARELKREELKELRESLEKLAGASLSAEPSNAYWDNQLYDVSERPLDMGNWKDRLFYNVGLANKWFAIDEEVIEGDPEYANVKFVISRTDEDIEKRVSKKQKLDRAKAKLLEIYDLENKLKFRLIAKYLLDTNQVLDNTSDPLLYEMLDDFIQKTEGNVAKFMQVVDKTPEDLQYKLKVDDAIRLNILKFRDGYYQRGNLTYGKTVGEVSKFLSLPENAGEFASIVDEIDDRLKLNKR